MGYLELILGSMYSGKSTELLRRVNQLKAIGMRCLVINHASDTRVDGHHGRTHDGQTFAAIKTSDILLVNTKGYDVVAIDEGQFFNSLRAAVMLMVERQDAHVIVAGLSGDYKRRPFGELLELVPLADDVCFKRALCKGCCHPGRLAAFTKRVSSETDTISVGAEYVPVCRMCYIPVDV